MFYLTKHSTHYVKDHRDSERGNPLLPHHGILFSISSKDSFHISKTGQNILHLMYTSCGALAGTEKISVGLPAKRIEPTTSLHLDCILIYIYIF